MNTAKGINICFLIALSLIFSSCGQRAKDIDGNFYETLKIGNQVWMAENLNVTHFRNGDSIPEVRSSEEWIRYGKEGRPACCTVHNDPENGKKYGRLYNWYAVNDSRGLAPKGWHVPSDDEWTYLTDFLGGSILAAFKMRETGLTDNNINIRKQGFSGLPGGARNAGGTFYGMASYGY